MPQLTAVEQRVWTALGQSSLPDAIARAASLSIPDTVGVLIRLELDGLVRNVGGRYERRHRSSGLPSKTG
jgi:predicted Rossmann fold nucleotide-binding protein DprA/Smf involved in DNA uptake